MINRTHTKGDIVSTALYSTCERYRYALTRCWDPQGAKVMFVMLNPSQATEVDNDPTVARCQKRAEALGYGAFQVTNLFAWRETDPRHMRLTTNPVGPRNADVIADGAEWADHIIAAWGINGTHLGQGPATEAMLRATGKPLRTLGLTKDGHPRHPLYVAYDQVPQDWPAR